MDAEVAAVPEIPEQSHVHNHSGPEVPKSGVQLKWNILRTATIGQSRVRDLEHRLAHSDCDREAHYSDRSPDSPESCVTSLTVPSVSTFTRLRRRLSSCKREWIARYLDAKGLDILLETFDQLCRKGISTLSDVFIQLECVACIKAIMNSQTGLDYIIENREFTRKLASGKIK